MSFIYRIKTIWYCQLVVSSIVPVVLSQNKSSWIERETLDDKTVVASTCMTVYWQSDTHIAEIAANDFVGLYARHDSGYYCNMLPYIFS